MFKDDDGVTIHANLDDTLIRATYRRCDLIPAFLEALRDTEEGKWYRMEYPLPDDGNDEWWDSDESCEVCSELMDALDCHAPDGWYFGTTEGDASDFGYWRMPDDYENTDEDTYE